MQTIRVKISDIDLQRQKLEDAEMKFLPFFAVVGLEAWPLCQADQQPKHERPRFLHNHSMRSVVGTPAHNAKRHTNNGVNLNVQAT